MPQSRTSGRKVHSVPWKKTTLRHNPGHRGINQSLRLNLDHNPNLNPHLLLAIKVQYNSKEHLKR